ncbi:MAG: IPT/TIG domain-containing protein [Opitutales bacterium]
MMDTLVRIVGAVALAACLTGCGPSLRNLTPAEVPRNPSGIYTLSMAVESSDGAVDRSSFEPKVVIDGQTFSMEPSDLGRYTYDFDFKMPEGRSKARYFYLLDYSAVYNGEPEQREASSNQTYTLELLDRYVLSLVESRGPVGASIAVVGKGFTPQDQVRLGGNAAPTQFVSPNALTFTVPAVIEGKGYPVTLSGPDGSRSLGTFTVDPSRFQVSPTSLKLGRGERSTLTIAIEKPAPRGGLEVDVRTDRPQSLIMPEVVIPSGERSVSVPVEGAAPAMGSIFLTARGFEQKRIPLEVTGSDAQQPGSEEAATRILETN